MILTRFVLVFGICIILGGTITECTVPKPVLKLEGSNIGVVGKSLTLTWNLTVFSDNQTPKEVVLFVARSGARMFLTLSKISFSNENVTRKKKKLDTTKPESIFNNITAMKNDGKAKFQLIVTSVPSNIESFIFKCKVSYTDIWMVPSVDVVSVQLASRPKVQLKVTNSSGNNAIGGRLEVVCAATGYPLPRVTLKKERKSQTTEIQSSFQNVSYSIQKVKASDAGKYICIAHNIADTVTKEVLVTIRFPPVVTFSIIKDTKSQYAVMGKDIKLVCSADGFPSPRLYLKKAVNSKVHEIVNSLKNITYSIPNIQPSDGGKFICLAENIAGKVKKEETVTVSYIKTPQTKAKDLIAKVNDELVLSCNISGFPSPVISWHKDGTKLPDASNKLSVKFHDDTHFGTYSCEGVNEAGEQTIQFSVVKIYPPSVTFIVIKESKSQHVVMGKDIKLICSAYGFPSPRLYLKKEVSSKVDEIVNSLENITYSVSNIQPSDAGKFICLAENIAGRVKKEETVTVSYIKTPQTTAKDLIAKVKDELILSCNISGFPSPAISWHKDGTKLPDASNKLSVKFHDDTHFGTYSCKGVNEAGAQTIKFSVVKTYVKTVVNKSNKITSKIGEKKTLHCGIEGNPKITHTWYKGKTKIGDSKTVTIDLDKKEEFGNYTCVGKNNAGEEVIFFSLTQKPIKSPRKIGGSSSTRTIFISPIIGLSLLATYLSQFIN